MLRAIEIKEGTRHGVARDELIAFDERLKQSTPYYLETLFGARRPPRRLHTPYCIVYSTERIAAALTAHLLIACLRMRRTASVRGRQADNE
jgi:hypothetical protein